MPRRVFAPVLVVVIVLPSLANASDPALELFQQRIMPIFNSPKPSSCIQCHLASVDLKDYIRPSHEETFLSLRDQGLIDVAQPRKSKILALIRMGDEDRDEKSKRLHAKTRQAELEAFAAWIAACCDDKALVARPPLSDVDFAKPDKSLEIIRHARKDRVLDSFIRNVWSQRMRCFPCHTPDEIDATNPQHAKPKERHAEFVAQYGARMNLFKATPESTMESLIASSRKSSARHLPLLNFADPENSLLLLKPTAKLPPKNDDGSLEKPSSVLPVSHMGGLKMHVDDLSYKAIVGWIRDLAHVREGRYASTLELPADNWYPSQHVLRMKEVPESWPAGGLVQLFVHDAKGGNVSAKPIAFTQGIVTPRRFVNGNLMLIRNAADESSRVIWDSSGGRLEPGEYVIKAYLDSNHRIEKDPGVLLGKEEFQGQLPVAAHWRDGFKEAEVVSGNELSQ